MPSPLLITGPPAALEGALAGALEAHRAEDPLAPLTVLVGGTLLRPYLRRRLAELTGGHLNLRLVTPAELALALGERRLQDRGLKPLSPLADRVLAREVAEASAGYFRPVGPTPGFAVALHRLFRELRQAGASPDDLRRAAASAKQRELASLYESYERRRNGFYAADDALLEADPALFEGARLLVYGLWDPGAALRQLLEALAERVELVVHLPSVSPAADTAHAVFRSWLMNDRKAREERLESHNEPRAGALPHLRHHLFAPSGPAPHEPSVQLLSAPDPSREVRAAARACLEWAREGIPFHDMALVYRQDDPYRGLAEAVFREAGIPVYLHGGTPLIERPLGRRAVALLELVDSSLERAAVMRFLTDARLPDATWERHGGVPAASWDALSRRAGIVEGREQWLDRLKRHREIEAARASDNDEPERLAARLDLIDRLSAVVSELDHRLEQRPDRAPWSAHLAFVTELFDTYLDDAEPLLAALEPLKTLDSVATDVTFDRFRDVLMEMLRSLRSTDVLNARPGAFARRGVNVLDVNSARGLGFRAVAVLGLAERAFPPPPRQDALLLDEERRALAARGGPELPLRALGPDPEPLQFALAVHSAGERLLLSYARTQDGDPRPQLPSPFLRQAATALRGETVSAEGLDALDEDTLTRLPAGRLGAATPGEALTAEEYDRTLLEVDRLLGTVALAARAPTVARALAAHRARYEDDHLTPYDGVLGEAAHAGLADRAGLAGPLSPSSLETYATCPYRFFLDRVLRLRPVEDPEQLERIDPMEKGTLVHRVLELFLTRCGDEDPPRPERREQHLELLSSIAREEFDDLERRGLTGHRLLWQLDRRQITDDLRLWYEHELRDEGLRGFDRGAFEVRFGPAFVPGEDASPLSTDEPLAVDAGGRDLLFKGRIDRVNWNEGEPAFRVTDYKTGKRRDEHGENRLSGGRALQLPLYLLATARILGMPPEAGEAHYHYATRRGGFERARFSGEALEEREADFGALLGRMADGILGGRFQAAPDLRKKCRWCDYHGLCPAQRERIAERKAGDPAAVAFAELEEFA